MRIPLHLLVAFALSVSLQGTTLQQLSLDDVIQKSTAIVRGRAQVSYTAATGTMLYTHYTITVSEQWKGASLSKADVALPGGTLNGVQQTYAGSPPLATDQEYVFFLWTSKSGLTQVIGLSQGLFYLTTDVSGTLMVTRPPAQGHLTTTTGQHVSDPGFSMPLTAFRSQVASTLAAKAGQ